MIRADSSLTTDVHRYDGTYPTKYCATIRVVWLLTSATTRRYDGARGTVDLRVAILFY
jgi:hypothetical protein